MQDRFKFRTFHIPTKTMEYNGLWTGYPDIEKKMSDCNFAVMQCTGLKDKNGKLIFEGDIVLSKIDKWIVKYCHRCKSFQCFDFENDCYSCLGDYTWAEFVSDRDEMEVIGNIYENKELLNE